MAKRAAKRPGIRERMEELLTEANLRTLEQLAAVHTIPRDRWHLVPEIAQPFETLALARLADAWREGLGLTKEGALLRAAEHLGLEAETHRSRLKRSRRRLRTKVQNAPSTSPLKLAS